MDTQNQTFKLVAVAAVSLVVGYFGGREHLKYEMRSAFTSAAEEFQKGLASAFSGKDASRPAKASPPSKSAEQEEESPPKPQPILATLTEKDFQASDWQAQIYEDAITFTVRFENRTGKDVRAFEGKLSFIDLLDNHILGAKVAINDPVKAGARMKWKGELEYNQFMDNHQKLRSEGLENIKTQFIVTKILFADGTSQKL